MSLAGPGLFRWNNRQQFFGYTLEPRQIDFDGGAVIGLRIDFDVTT